MGDYFNDKGDLIDNKITSGLHKLTTRPLKTLDKMLLSNFYNSDRSLNIMF